MMLPILGGVFWSDPRGDTWIVRHCDVAFELFHRGIAVMPVGTFRQVHDYLWSEFPPCGFEATTKGGDK